MPTPTQAQVDRFLQSIEYPADKEQLVQRATQKRVARSLRSLIEELPNQPYDNPADVRQALESLEPTLRGASEAPAAEAEQPQGPRLQLPEPIRQAAADARVRSGRLVSEARTQATQRADEQRGVLAQGLATTAHEIRQTSARLTEQGQQPPGQAMEFAAAQLESLSNYLQRTDVTQIAQQAQEFARRQPLLVLGIGIGLGAVAVRLLKSADLGRLAGADSSTGGPSDAMGLLEAEHRQIRGLLRRGDSAGLDRRRAVLAEIKTMLQAHERIEEEVFYPALLQNASTRQIVLESYAEHHIVDEIMSEIEQTDPSDDLWKARFTTMRENLEHHIEQEETQLFTLTRSALTRGELAELGSRMQQIKQLSQERAPA